MELLTAADVAVACQASSGRELLDYLAGELPDAVLLDIRMEGRPDDGLTTADVTDPVKWSPGRTVLLKLTGSAG